MISKLKENGGSIKKALKEIFQKTGEAFSDTYAAKKAKEFGLVYAKKIRIKKKEGGLTNENKLARMNYCYWLSQCDPEYFIWSDEVCFPLRRETENSEWQTKNTPKFYDFKAYNPNVHLWGAITFTEKSSLRFLPLKTNWNAYVYEETLRTHLMPFIEKCFPEKM